jgi:hypothetical protein
MFLFSHKVYLHYSVEGDGWPSPDRISYYLLGGVRRFKVGLDLDLVATKHWLAPIRLLRVPLSYFKLPFFPLKTICREVKFQAVVFLVVSILKLVSFAHRTSSLSSTPGALCVPGAALALCYTVR